MPAQQARREPLAGKELAQCLEQVLRKQAGRGLRWMESLRLGGVLRARTLWGKLPKSFRQAPGGISVVPKVPFNLKIIRRQVRGFFITWQRVTVPGLGEPLYAVTGSN